MKTAGIRTAVADAGLRILSIGTVPSSGFVPQPSSPPGEGKPPNPRLRLVAAGFAFGGIGKGVRLVFAGARFEALEVFFNDNRECRRIVEPLIVFHAHLVRTCPSLAHPLG